MEVEFFSANIWFLLLLSILPKFTVETPIQIYKNLPFLLPPVHLSEIYKKFWREHCQGGGSTASRQIVSTKPSSEEPITALSEPVSK